MTGRKGAGAMAKATKKDATLMIQLAQWGCVSGADEAGNWMYSDEFTPDYAEFLKKYPAGSEGWAKAFKILGWYETVGTIYKHGLINEDLLFDWMAAYDVWDRMKGIALGIREEFGDAALWENFEAMAKAQKG
jgi:hypothetical protein